MGLFEEEKKTHHCLGQRVQLDFKYRGQCPAWLSAVPLGSVCFAWGSVLFRCNAKIFAIRKIGKNPVKRRIDLFQPEKLEKQYSTLNVQFLVIAVKALKK